MFDFLYYAPTKVAFGKDALGKLGGLLTEQGARKVLLHYGGGHAVRSGLLDRVKGLLDAAGVAWVELGGVVPNPRLSLVREGAALCQREGVDFILAVGGGSVIDSAKAMGYALGEPDKDVWELYAHTRAPKASYPVGAVVTIAAAGSEMSDSSVITNWETGEKRGCNSNVCRLKFAVMDPQLTMSLPDEQTQAGCADILMHTMERYFTQGGNLALTDAIAQGLMRTVMTAARALHTSPGDYQARAEVMWASSLSHNGLTGCGSSGGDWACHGLEHELSGMFDVTHGAGLTAIWGTWARYVMAECLPRFVSFAVNVMDVAPGGSPEATALAGIEAMEDFYRSMGLPTSLRELGIDPTDEQCERMAASCARAAGGKKGNAKVLTEPDMAAIYKAAR